MNHFTRINLLLFHIICINAFFKDFNIGGLFDSRDKTLERVFQFAVEKVNTLQWLLPNSRLKAQVEILLNEDCFAATQKVCSMLENEVVAFFGPQSQITTTATVESICNSFEIPFINTGWDYSSHAEGYYSLNLYPHSKQLSIVLAEIVKKFYWWDSLAVLYEDSRSLAKFQDILQLRNKHFHVILWQLPNDNNYRNLLRDIKKNRHFNILLECSVDILPDLLMQALQIGLMTDSYEYFITNLDMQTIDYENYKYSGTNITGIRLLDLSKQEVQDIISEWNLEAFYNQTTENNLKTETALMYDSVLVFASALHALQESSNISTKPLFCDSNDTWAYGNNLINHIKLEEISEQLPTLTGRPMYDTEGFRTNFYLDIIKVTSEGFLKIGYWNSSALNMTLPPQLIDLPEEKIVYNITTIYKLPYFMNRNGSTKLTGNDRFEGYVVDLVEKIAEIVGFNYNLVPVPDNMYGIKIQGTNKWNGMIGEVLKGKAQIAVSDLTMTSEREQVVDYTFPFMHFGISLLYKAKERQKPALFSFLKPFSTQLWIYVLTAYLGISFVLLILARFTPYEWNNSYPCITDPNTLQNKFSVLNSLWFTIGTIMQQGTDVAPRAISTRMLATMWSFFTIIIISSYTANLIAFLTLESDYSSINVIEDLLTQTKVKYGCIQSSSVHNVFKTSPMQIHQDIYKRMNVFFYDTSTAINKVNTSDDYAVFLESVVIDYAVASGCGLRNVLTSLGGYIVERGYAIVVKKGDPLRDRLTSALLALQEDQELEKLERKWWTKKSKNKCHSDSKSGKGFTKTLIMDHVIGVFVVLLIVTGLGFIIAVIEFMWNIRKSVRKEKGSYCSEMSKELKLIAQCHKPIKPIKKPVKDADKDLTNVEPEMSEQIPVECKSKV